MCHVSSDGRGASEDVWSRNRTRAEPESENKTVRRELDWKRGRADGSQGNSG